MIEIFEKLRYKIIFLPIILATILISVLISNFCIPDGCTYNPRQICGTDSCVGESIFDHIQERVNLFSALPAISILALLMVIFLAFYSNYFRLLAIHPPDKSYFGKNFIKFLELKIFDPLLDALSNGRLCPQIYPSHQYSLILININLRKDF